MPRSSNAAGLPPRAARPATLAARIDGSARGHVLHRRPLRRLVRTVKRAADADGASPHGALEPPFQEALHLPPARRDQQEKSEEVGEHTWRDKHRCRHEDQHAISGNSTSEGLDVSVESFPVVLDVSSAFSSTTLSPVSVFPSKVLALSPVSVRLMSRSDSFTLI